MAYDEEPRSISKKDAKPKGGRNSHRGGRMAREGKSSLAREIELRSRLVRKGQEAINRAKPKRVRRPFIELDGSANDTTAVVVRKHLARTKRDERHDATNTAAIERIRRIRAYPSRAGIRRLEQIIRDTNLAKTVRTEAAGLLLEMAELNVDRLE